ncbi:MAG: universal stress protein [Gammaproteobacteria bacterium]|jgi:nucleotide-binding universal stress UspA family protein|nr:universal stress protein [Gammaproteobacteria bacterium]
MFNSIVAAYDGSANAGRALEAASRLAAGAQARMCIIYVIDIDHMSSPLEIRKMGGTEGIIESSPNFMVDLETASPELVNKLAKAQADSYQAKLEFAEYLLTQALKTARDCGASDVETKFVQGDPAQMVVEFANERNADLIVCGSRGLGRLKQLLLGSTSHKINQLAACSCLTVK